MDPLMEALPSSSSQTLTRYDSRLTMGFMLSYGLHALDLGTRALPGEPKPCLLLGDLDATCGGSFYGRCVPHRRRTGVTAARSSGTTAGPRGLSAAASPDMAEGSCSGRSTVGKSCRLIHARACIGIYIRRRSESCALSYLSQVLSI